MNNCKRIKEDVKAITHHPMVSCESSLREFDYSLIANARIIISASHINISDPNYLNYSSLSSSG